MASKNRGGSPAYVVWRDGMYRVNKRRVSLDSIVYAFIEGQSPESILDSFPMLTLEQIYGAITFYLANKRSVDEYLRERKVDYEKRRRAARAENADLYHAARATAGAGPLVSLSKWRRGWTRQTC